MNRLDTQQIKENLIKQIKKNQEDNQLFLQYQHWTVGLSVFAIVLSCLSLLILWGKA